MPSWWNSLDAVTRFNNWMQVALAVFAVFTAVAIILNVLSANKISSLQAIEENRLKDQLEDAMEAARKQAERVQELEEKQKPRHITPEQSQTILARLSKFQGEINIRNVVGDSEAQALSVQLYQILDGAGWKVRHEGQAAQSVSGVRLRVGSVENPPPYTAPLVDALQAVGIDVLVYERQGNPITLIVGNKP